MKKKLLFLILVSLFLVLPSVSSYAMYPSEVTSRTVCPSIELALAKSDGGLDNISCYDDYYTAKSVMDADSREDLVIIENGIIIDAKYALIDYNDIKSVTLNVYKSSTSNSKSTYIYSAEPDDATLIDYDYSTKRVKIRVAGVTGWIDKYTNGSIAYDIVPIVWIKSPQYYQVTDSNITHVFPGNVYGTGSNYAITIDLKPSMLNEGNYYSYDGHYFYTNLKTLINDYKNKTYENSVNPTNPYYNYYQYLPFRTKTVYTAESLNEFIASKTGSDSKLWNTGEAFIEAQEKYGINAAIMLSIGINESGWGNSTIAKDKNNLFGLGAIDSNPYLASNSFDSPGDCIKVYAYTWLSYGYVQPGDWRFNGANVGNKGQGLNVQYASDPFWGEKAAANYYQLDKRYDFQERKTNTYDIAVLNNNYQDGIYATKTPGGEIIDNEDPNNTGRYYKYQVVDSPIVVIGEETDASGKVWYKIQSDPTLTDTLKYTIANSKTVPMYEYNWNTYVYVPSEYFRKITDPVTVYPSYDTAGNSSNPNVVTVSTIVTRASYRYQTDAISGIKIGTDANTVITSITNQGGEVSITDVNGNTKSGNLATGDKVTVTFAGEVKTLDVVIYGDITGDGEIDKTDCSEILRQYYGYANYSGAMYKALDVNRDGKVDKLDASEVLRQYYGYSTINQ